MHFLLDTLVGLRQTEGSLGCCVQDNARLIIEDLVKIRVFILTLVSAACVFGQLQQPPQETSSASGNSSGYNPVTLASEFFDRGNFVNYYAFANAVYDTYAPTLNSSGQYVNNGGFGYGVGGGVGAYHAWSKSTLSLAYSANFSQYTSSFFTSGTNQNLNLSFNRQLSRRWSLGVGVLAGNVLYGTGYLGAQADTAGNVQLNPFSPNTRYLTGYASLSYQQSRRLSYFVSGGFYLQRFSYSGAVGTTGGSGSGGVNYRITSRTSIFGSYSHSYYAYQMDAGNTYVDGVSFGISHTFKNRWGASAYGGITHSNVNGLLNIPVGIITPTGVTSGFLRVPYVTTAVLPAFGGSISRYMRKSQFSFGGGQSVISGNGYYLASQSRYLSGNYSRSFQQRTNASFGGYWSRLSSVSGTMAYSYNTSGFGASYSYVILSHVSAYARYDFVRYGTISSYAGVSDNRFSFGFSFSSKSIPLTLY
jgi:hypothetical protein